MTFLILCSVLYSVLLGDNINDRMQTKSNLGILRNGGREMRVEWQPSRKASGRVELHAKGEAEFEQKIS